MCKIIKLNGNTRNILFSFDAAVHIDTDNCIDCANMSEIMHIIDEYIKCFWTC